MIETTRIDEWLYTLLSADTELNAVVDDRVYGYVAPQGAAMPFVLFAYQGGRDVRGVGPSRIMASALYQVKVVGEGASFSGLEAIADRLDALLQGASGSVTDGAVLMCVREQPIVYVEVDNGVQYRHLGGLWRIIAQATPEEPDE